MRPNPRFFIEQVDGCHLGKLWVPLPQVADWLNFLIAPHYDIEILSVEQGNDHISIAFQASEGVYLYLDRTLNASELALAS